MRLEWTWYALPGLVSLALAWAVGAFVYFARPDRAQNRHLALFIVLAGLYIAAGSAGLALAADAEAARGAAAFAFVGPVALGPYLLFLATLDTPLVAWLRPRPVQALLALATAAVPLSYFAWREGWVRSVVGAPGGTYSYVSGPVDVASSLLALLLFLFGFVVALHAWRRSPRASAVRARSAAYALAFGIRDALYVALLAVFVPVAAARPGDPQVQLLQSALLPLVEIVYLPLLVYGIAKTSLFDIDLKIKWTIRRGTVAAVFVAVFAVVTQLAQEVLSDEVGYLAGGVAAGVLLLALRPLERAADRVADAALPGVRASPQYDAFRKLEVYKAAVESAYETGGIDVRERATLDRLRSKLGIAADAAALVERDVASAA